MVLIHALEVVEHPKVRRALYAALRNFKTERVGSEIERHFSREESYFAEAEGIRSLAALHHPRYPEILRSALKQESWNDIFRISALEGFAASRSREWIPLIHEYTRAGRNQRTRMAAIRGLASYDPVPTAVQDRLIELTNDPFLLVRISAVRALQQVGDERALPALRKLTKGDLDGRLMRMAEEAVEKLSKGVEDEKKKG